MKWLFPDGPYRFPLRWCTTSERGFPPWVKPSPEQLGKRLTQQVPGSRPGAPSSRSGATRRSRKIPRKPHHRDCALQNTLRCDPIQVSQWRRHQLDGASKLSKLVDHEHPEIGFSRHLRCWEYLDQRSTTNPNRCGKRRFGSWPGSILSIRSMPATAPSSGPARFAAFITAETGGLGPQAVPNLRMSVPNGNQIAPTATKTHCCACGFEICVPVSYTGTQGSFSSRRAALLE